MIDLEKAKAQAKCKANVKALVINAVNAAMYPEGHDWLAIWENMDIVKNHHAIPGHPHHIADADLFIDAIAEGLAHGVPDEIARIIYVLMGFEAC